MGLKEDADVNADYKAPFLAAVNKVVANSLHFFGPCSDTRDFIVTQIDRLFFTNPNSTALKSTLGIFQIVSNSFTGSTNL